MATETFWQVFKNACYHTESKCGIMGTKRCRLFLFYPLECDLIESLEGSSKGQLRHRRFLRGQQSQLGPGCTRAREQSRPRDHGPAGLREQSSRQSPGSWSIVQNSMSGWGSDHRSGSGEENQGQTDPSSLRPLRLISALKVLQLDLAVPV